MSQEDPTPARRQPEDTEPTHSLSEEINELDIFSEAIELSASQRATFLAQACGGDQRIQARIEALIVQDERANEHDFLAPAELNLKKTLAAAPDLGHFLGREIGPFRIVKSIGRGGMGEVFLAERMSGYDQQVAIKLLRPGLSPDEMLRRFRTEAQFTAALGEHPNIAGLIDAGTTQDGYFYLVTDYVDGVRIDEYCDSHQFSNDQRLQLFLKVCDAVQFAHQRAVIHRDLKPSNILVSRAGEVRLIDFGIAKLLHPQLEPHADATRTLYRIMTPDYASPEQARGEPTSTASDVYSLGVVLYRLLTGCSPYEVDTTNPLKLAEAIENVQPTHPSAAITQTPSLKTSNNSLERIAQNRKVTPAKLKRELHGDLGTIVLMALRKEPERRYGTAQQFAEDIRRALSGHPVRARNDTLGYRTSKFVRRNRWKVASAGVLLSTLLAGIAGTTTQWIRAEQESSRAEVNAINARREATRAEQLAQRESQARVTAQAAAEAARLRAETAKEVSSFMARLFRGADSVGFLDFRFGSNLARQDEPTARELLDSGAQLLETELQDQLPVRSVLKTYIAQVFLSLGELDRAVQLLQSARKTQSQLKGELPAEEAIETAGTLAMARYIEGNYDQSIALFRETADSCDALYGSQDPRGADAKMMLGFVLIEAAPTVGDWEEGCRIIRQVVAIHENDPHVSSVKLAVAYAGQAIVERTEGNIAAAMLSIGKSGRLVAEMPFGSLYGRAVLLAVQASINWQAGNNQPAAEETRELIEIVEQALGDRHPLVNYIQVDQSQRMYWAGEHEPAEELLRSGIAAARLAYGRQPRTAFALNRLATQLLERNTKLEEAKELAREAVEIYSQVLGPNHVATKAAAKTLDQVITKTNN